MRNHLDHRARAPLSNQINNVFAAKPLQVSKNIVSLHPEHLNNDDYGSNDNKKTAHYALHELLS
jgi:hypothetical protein